MTILITGARGAVGSSVLHGLRAAGHPLRASSRRPEQLRLPVGVRSTDVEVVPLDLARPATFAAALRGVEQVFLYAEPGGIDELVRAAEAAGVRHVVLLSSSAALSPDAEDDPLGRHHLLVERALTWSNLDTTILRPGAFAGNAYGWSQAIRRGDPVDLAYPEALLAPIHEDDIADVAVTALTGNAAVRGRAVTLTGPHGLTLREQVGEIAVRLGRDVPVRRPTRAAAEEQLGRFMPADVAASLLDHQAGTVGIRPEISTAERITGKPGRTFGQWVDEHLDAFRPH
ncbi:SDR family oxidoreductase [Micromonospora zhanjiangensis]|uniref:SDR family oxidoreductase n=1 Tax=Micromonospora zhanjiangensis TaxID=1522057 RepID=A0ABV8KLX1_9ACTN